MDQKYESLFTPWKVGNVEIKNRIVMCPMGGTSLFGWFELTGCGFDKEAAKLFLERANNNVGLIIPGIAPLRDTFWGKWLWQNPKMFEELKVYMDEIHKTGAKLFIQLTAGMGRSWAITELVGPLHKNKFTRAILKPILDTNHELAAPSPLPSRWAPEITTPERMDRVSTSGYAFGYIGSCIPFALCLVLALCYESFGISQVTALIIGFAITGAWWFACSLPLMKHYKQTAYQPPVKGAFLQTFRQLWQTIKEAKKKKHILLYLIAFFFYIDGVYTIIDMTTA